LTNTTTDVIRKNLLNKAIFQIVLIMAFV